MTADAPDPGTAGPAPARLSPMANGSPTDSIEHRQLSTMNGIETSPSPRNGAAGRKSSRLAALLAVACLLVLATIVPATAFTIEFQGRNVKRTLLALYDSKTEGALNQSRLHKLAEMPLNH